MTCKHENADHLMPGQFTMLEDGRLITALVEQFRCIDCGAWLSLGESDEHASEHVEIEIRAAHLAHGENNEHEFSGLEWCGFGGDEQAYVDGVLMYVSHHREWRAGYLAHCIVEDPSP